MADDADDDIDIDDDEIMSASENTRAEELINKEAIKKACKDIFKEVEKGYVDQYDRSNAAIDYWDLYHCELGSKQFYNGNSKIFVPIVHDAVNARVTRFVNQMFPQSGRHIEVIANEDTPQALTSLLEHYIRKAKLRTSMAPALCRNGDVEGQYTIYISWVNETRHVSQRVKRGPTIDAPATPQGDMGGGMGMGPAIPGMPGGSPDMGMGPEPGMGDMGMSDMGMGEPEQLGEIEGLPPTEDIQDETIERACPRVEVVADADLLVLPFTSASINEAIENGGSVSIIRRWSKAKIRKLIREGEIDKDKGQDLLKSMAQKAKSEGPDLRKSQLAATGIHVGDGIPTAQVIETWTKIKVKDEYRICRMYFGGEDNLLSCKRNPYWNDKVPVLSAPITKTEGVFKGISRLKYVETIQLAANDAVNEGMDSAAYALLPIIMTDPEKNPRVGSMVLNVAAIWQTSPKDTQFAQFPQLWKEAFAIVNSCKEQILQTLSVNPAMMAQQVSGGNKKLNQAQIANEQQVDILTTADAVTNIEGEILSPMLQWFVELDHQYREDEMLVPSFGSMGAEVEMLTIEPIQMDKRFEFRWFGVEAARNAQQLQMQMAGMNTIRGIPPQLYPGYRLDLAPVIVQFIENTFGPRLGRRMFKSIKEELSLNPEFENQMLAQGMPLEPHPLDDDVQHMQAHMQEFGIVGDMTGELRAHLIKHQMQLAQKNQAQMQQQAMQRQGMPGSPGGPAPSGNPPGLAGTPRPGAAPGGPRPNGQNPPGAIHPDEMQNVPPRARN